MQQKKTLTPPQRWEYFPRFGLVYFAWTVVMSVLAAFAVDRALLPYLENRGELNGEAWVRQNELLFRMMVERNQASWENPIIRTNAITVSSKCPRLRRILVLGDSFVWGHGVTNMNYLWWRQLQIELERRGYTNVEVIGAGMCGAYTHAELEWAPKLLNQYHPDLIIWSYVANDPVELDDNTGKLMVPVQIVNMDTRFKGWAEQVHEIFPNLVYHLLDLRNQNESRLHSDTEAGFDFEHFELEILKGPNFEKYKNTVRLIAEFIEQSKIPNLFVMMVSPDPKDMIPRMTPVETVFSQNKIPYLDVLKPMTEWYQRRFKSVPVKPAFMLGVSPVDPHPGPLSTHFYAVQTANLLEQKYTEVLGPRFSPVNSLTRKLEINDWEPISINLQNRGKQTYTLTYPAPAAEMLTMPLRRPFIQLSFSGPVRLKEIELSGADLSSAAIALGLENPSTHESRLSDLRDFGFQQGKTLRFHVTDKDSDVSEIKLSAIFSGKNRTIQLRFLEN